MAATLSSGRQGLLRFQPRRRAQCVLVDVNVAAHELGLHHEEVVEMAECGELRWVFDVSVHANRIRELRFWVGELMRRDARSMDEAEVLAAVVGHPTEVRLRGSTVCDVLMLRRPTVHDLMAAHELSGEVVGKTLWVDRRSLVDFLRRRLVA